MIVSFSLKNWMSFRDQATFSMVASRERQHGERIPSINKYRTKILPLAAIYGGNASGKSNFFKAIAFSKEMIVEGTRPESLIPVEPFLLDDAFIEQPSHLIFELLLNESIYEFSFAATRHEIIEEKLVHITSSSEKVLYHRLSGEKFNLDSSLDNQDFLKFAFIGTRNNQLFLTNSVSQNVDNFKPVYDWFKETLVLVDSTSCFMDFDKFLDKRNPLHSNMNEILSQLDTGIIHLDSEEIPLETIFNNIPLSDPLKAGLHSDVIKGVTDSKAAVLKGAFNERFVVTRKNGELIANKLVTKHLKTDGAKATFDIQQESEGIQRVLDLLLVLLEQSHQSSTRVYIIDEFDRSLHTLLTRGLLEGYLANCSEKTRTQLLLSTHDVLLMDQNLLRRDEMWIAERDSTGSSSLLSFSEFEDVRYDKDIRKSYLQGRMGGIPQILLGDFLPSSDAKNSSMSEEIKKNFLMTKARKKKENM